MIRVALFKFTSCSGCLFNTILKLTTSDTLLEKYRIVYSRELGVRESGEYDLVFIEGSITSNEQERQVKMLRDQCRFMVALGSCTILGGVQSMIPPSGDIKEEYMSRPITEIVRVDYVIPGCPVSDEAVVDFLYKFSLRGYPIEIHEPLCAECKRMGYECVLVTRGEICLGPLTTSGCRALCPSMNRGCYGCSGLRAFDIDQSVVEALVNRLAETGAPREHVRSLISLYGVGSSRRLKSR